MGKFAMVAVKVVLYWFVLNWGIDKRKWYEIRVCSLIFLVKDIEGILLLVLICGMIFRDKQSGCFQVRSCSVGRLGFE